MGVLPLGAVIEGTWWILTLSRAWVPGDDILLEGEPEGRREVEPLRLHFQDWWQHLNVLSSGFLLV